MDRGYRGAPPSSEGGRKEGASSPGWEQSVRRPRDRTLGTAELPDTCKLEREGARQQKAVGMGGFQLHSGGQGPHAASEQGHLLGARNQGA